MTLTGQIQLGAVQIIDPSTKDLLGYAYTVESEGGQTQRWLLYRNPENTLEIVAPPTSMAGWTLADWRANVPALWKPGSFYVWARTRLYRYGQTYGGVVWTSIPPASELPAPTFPAVPGSDYQLDPTPWRALDVRQQDWTGQVYTVGGGLTAETSAEYWALPAGYQAAGGALSAAVSVGAAEASSLQGFVNLANASWRPGSAFAITGCVNYRGEAPPAGA